MSGELINKPVTPEAEALTAPDFEDRLSIIDEAIRKNYLSRLSAMRVQPIGEIPELEDDLIRNVRLFRINEMVYRKGESVTDKFTTVFNTLSTYDASVFVLIDSDGKRSEFYLGIRSNSPDENSMYSTVTLCDTLKQTLIGHFPGVKVEDMDRQRIKELSTKITGLGSVSSVSVVGNRKGSDKENDGNFVQGIEKLVYAMSGRAYTAIIIARNRPSKDVQVLRKSYQDLYSKLAPLQKVQYSSGQSTGESRTQSFAEKDGKGKLAAVAGALASVGGAIGGYMVGEQAGLLIGSQLGGQLNSFISSLVPAKQFQEQTNTSSSTTYENKSVTDMMALLDGLLQRANEFDSYGMWNVAGYFLSDDMSSAEIAAGNYRSLMNGENSGREVSAVNSWQRNKVGSAESFEYLTTYLSRYVHPQFLYGEGIPVDASTEVSGKELGLHLGLPRNTVSGLPVIEHAEFGKEVTSYRLIPERSTGKPEDRMTIGRIFDLGQITDKKVELQNSSLNMHTFITGSTGSGKSNAVYQMLAELRQDNIPFLVVEPAKGEYKDVFGHLPGVSVFSTNPAVAELININPFMFPDSIHVLEHVDGLIEIFSACWPMYDAMPAFFKEAVLRAYEEIGWDLGSSTFIREKKEYPNFARLVEELDRLIEESDYASDVKSNYRGALLTRVRSLTVGLNKYIFTSEQTPYEILFDKDCILDISRVKSSETKALIMGLMVYILNEYRVDRKSGSNHGLRHVTVLEEAHNLLKNSEGNTTELVSKSVEMLTNTIAEVRTYGEGFIIVDQSPSSVDASAIKNTNTKIVLRTPEAHDREAVGRSIGLTAEQVEEIAKLPTGVAVVYQNDWVSPVLTMLNKAKVAEKPYEYSGTQIKPIRAARTEILVMLLHQWFHRAKISGYILEEDLRTLELSRQARQELQSVIDDYAVMGKERWLESEYPLLRRCIKDVLGIPKHVYDEIGASGDAQALVQAVEKQTFGLSREELRVVCYFITMEDN